MTGEVAGVRNETEEDSRKRIEGWRQMLPTAEDRDLPGPGEAFGPEYEAPRGDALNEGNAESVEDPGSALRQISDGTGISSLGSADDQAIPRLGAGGDVERDGSGSDEPDRGMGSGSVIRPITGPVRTSERDEGSHEVGRPRGKMALRPIPRESRTLRGASSDADEFPTDDEVLDGISIRGSKKKKSRVIRPIKPE